MQGRHIGFAFTGSFCTFERVIPQVERLVKLGAQVTPIFSETAANTDTRFGTAQEFVGRLERITGRKAWTTIVEVEPIGPKKLLDLLVIAPCTGNTLAKLACGITDSSATMAAKAQLRNCRPVLIGVSTNDALGANAKNIGLLLNVPNVYFVPLKQDDPEAKANSVVAEMELIVESAAAAMEGRQLQPVLVS